MAPKISIESSFFSAEYALCAELDTLIQKPTTQAESIQTLFGQMQESLKDKDGSFAKQGLTPERVASIGAQIEAINPEICKWMSKINDLWKEKKAKSQAMDSYEEGSEAYEKVEQEIKFIEYVINSTRASLHKHVIDLRNTIKKIEHEVEEAFTQEVVPEAFTLKRPDSFEKIPENTGNLLYLIYQDVVAGHLGEDLRKTLANPDKEFPYRILCAVICSHLRNPETDLSKPHSLELLNAQAIVGLESEDLKHLQETVRETDQKELDALFYPRSQETEALNLRSASTMKKLIWNIFSNNHTLYKDIPLTYPDYDKNYSWYINNFKRASLAVPEGFKDIYVKSREGFQSLIALFEGGDEPFSAFFNFPIRMRDFILTHYKIVKQLVPLEISVEQFFQSPEVGMKLLEDKIISKWKKDEEGRLIVSSIADLQSLPERVKIVLSVKNVTDIFIALNDSRVIKLNAEELIIDASVMNRLASVLRVNRTLTSLNLCGNKIDSEGAKELAAVLRENRTLTSLDLSYNEIGLAGVGELALALRENETLTSLNLCGNEIDSEGVKELAAALRENRTLTSLDLSYNEIDLAGVKQLAEEFKKNETLTSLNLCGNEIDSEGANELTEFLRENRTLTSLDLSNNKIDLAGVKQLAEVLKTNQTLTSLNLSNNKIGLEEAKELAEMISTNQTLTSLNLSENAIGPEGAKALAEALKGNRMLTSLDLHENEIGFEGAKALAEALKINQALTSLNLSGNAMGPEGTKELADALKINKMLTSLHLSGNEIGSEGAKAIGDALKVNQTLTSLDLFYNNISLEGVKELAAALKINQTLTLLYLHNNSINLKGAKELAAALKENRALTSLNLYNNSIGSEGAKELAAALKDNQTLISLDLGGNRIDSTTKSEVEEILQSNTNLKITW